METKKSAEAHTANAMMFDGVDYLDADGLARKFAGDGGRIATMVDVAHTRRVSDPDELIWQRPIITSSAEYFGRSALGTPLIIVAHGVGPMADDSGIFESTFGAPAGLAQKGGVISQEEFLRLESGAYGPVDVVPLASVWKRKNPFQECITAEQAMEDPLIRARLGEMCDYYLAHHNAISVAWARGEHGTSRGHECMLMNRDPHHGGYLAKEPDGTFASAHLLSISGLVEYRHGHWGDDRRHVCLTSFLSCHEWGDEGWVVGYRGGHVLRPHPGPGIVRDRFAKVWQRLLKSGPPPLPTARRIHALMDVGGMLFTRYESSGCGPDGGEPEFPVSNAARTGTVTFNFPTADGDYRHPRIDAAVIKAAAPHGVNAFRITDVRPSWKGSEATHHVVKVDYYRIEVGYRMRVPPMAKLREDFDLLLTLDG